MGRSGLGLRLRRRIGVRDLPIPSTVQRRVQRRCQFELQRTVPANERTIQQRRPPRSVLRLRRLRRIRRIRAIRRVRVTCTDPPTITDGTAVDTTGKIIVADTDERVKNKKTKQNKTKNRKNEEEEKNGFFVE